MILNVQTTGWPKKGNQRLLIIINRELVFVYGTVTSCQLKVDDTQLLRLPYLGPPFTIVTIQFKKPTY